MKERSLWGLGRNRNFRENYFRRPGDAIVLLTLGKFRVLLCPTWFFGWQTTEGSVIVCLIPPLGFEWRG